jgi:hypothetical protein
MEHHGLHEASTDNPTGHEPQRSASENIRELTEASKQLLAAGKQLTDNLTELSEHVEHAKNVSAEVLRSPWLIAMGAIAAGALVLLISRHR